MKLYTQQLKSLAFRIGALIVLYTTLRAVFFIIYPLEDPISFFDYLWIYVAGIRFDLIAILYLNSPWLLLEIIPLPFSNSYAFKIFQFWLFIALNFLGILFNLIDLAYYDYLQKRSTAELFDIWKDVAALASQYILEYWYLLLTLVGIIWILIIIYKKTDYEHLKIDTKSVLPRAIQSLFLIALMLIGLRGGLQVKPAVMLTATATVDAGELPYVINTPFSIFMTLNKERLEEKNEYDLEELDEIFPGRIRIQKEANNKNVVVLILESFSFEFVGAINDRDTSYTPFLDSLSKEAIVFKNFTSNAGNSIAANSAIFASIPNLMSEAYMISAYQSNRMGALPRILGENGYVSSFYHGASNGSMFFDAFASSAGFDKYVGRTEYNNEDHYDGNWGIYDGQFLKYVADDLNEMKEPFFAAFFSLSNHHPFKVPEPYRSQLSGGTIPIHKTVQYTDEVLKEFFDNISKQAWYKNTLFVITADHTSMTEFKYSKKRRGAFRVPLILFDPSGDLEPRLDLDEAQHLDLKPTILDYLGVKGDYNCFGVNLLDSASVRMSFQERSGLLQLTKDGWMLVHSGIKSKHLYHIATDRMMKEDLLSKESKKAKELERILKAVVQRYNYRMIHDKLAL